MTARFHAQDRVTVRVGTPPGHFRTPEYIQGKTGIVVALCGVFPNPESLAYGGDGLPKQPLYRVQFPQSHVWDHYQGAAADTLLIDLYEHWLDPAQN